MSEVQEAANRIRDRFEREWKMCHVAGENSGRVLSKEFADMCECEAEILYELVDFISRKFLDGKK